MPEPKWLILTALAMEGRAITQAFGVRLADGAGPTLLPAAGLGRLWVIGPRAARLSDEMIAGHSRIILAGLAGALDPALNIGDVIIDAADDRQWPNLPYRRGAIHSSDHLVATAAGKRRVFEQTGAAAVDMESAIVRQRAAAVGAAVLSIRAINDAADESLPPDLVDWIDPMGRVRPASVASGVARRPWEIGRMVRLARHCRCACRAMALAVRQALS